MAHEIFELTPEQKTLVLKHYATLELTPLTRLVFPEAKGPDGKPVDGRSIHAQSIKAFLASLNKEMPRKRDDPRPLAIVLTDEQKEQIQKLADRTDNLLEITRIVFNDPKLHHFSHEGRAVTAYYKEVFPDRVNMSEDPVEEKLYKPPVAMPQLIAMVNAFVQGSGTAKTFKADSLKPSERKCLEALMTYLRVYRLKYVATQYEKQVDRDLFLSTFVRWTYNKSDLTEMEVDTVISAAAETVTVAQLEREIQQIKAYHENIMRGEETDTVSGKRKHFGMAEVEQINGVRGKHDASKRRLEILMEKLETARSERVNARDSKYTNISDILNIWTKDVQRRQEWIDAGIEEKDEDAKEVERLKGLEDILAMISGQSEDEARV